MHRQQSQLLRSRDFGAVFRLICRLLRLIREDFVRVTQQHRGGAIALVRAELRTVSGGFGRMNLFCEKTRTSSDVINVLCCVCVDVLLSSCQVVEIGLVGFFFAAPCCSVHVPAKQYVGRTSLPRKDVFPRMTGEGLRLQPKQLEVGRIQLAFGGVVVPVVGETVLLLRSPPLVRQHGWIGGGHSYGVGGSVRNPWCYRDDETRRIMRNAQEQIVVLWWIMSYDSPAEC